MLLLVTLLSDGSVFSGLGLSAVAQNATSGGGACNQIDLVFVVDHSSSVSDNSVGDLTNWFYIQQFMTSIVQGLTIGPNSARIAVVTFGDNATIEFGFNNYTNIANLTQVSMKSVFYLCCLQVGFLLQQRIDCPDSLY